MKKEHPISAAMVGRQHVKSDRDGNMVKAPQKVDPEDPMGYRKATADFKRANKK